MKSIKIGSHLQGTQQNIFINVSLYEKLKIFIGSANVIIDIETLDLDMGHYT